MADPFAGRVTYFKVISGVVKNDANLVNARTGGAERLAHIGSSRGKTIQPVTELQAGRYRRGRQAERDAHRRHAGRQAFASSPIPPVHLPEPSIAFAISAKSRNDEDRMGNAIQRILEEDQSLRFYRDPQTKEFLLAGSGQQHVEIIVSRLKKRYGVDVELHAPENSLSRNHSRKSRRAGPAQEADRRSRPVRRLLDSPGAAPARREVLNSPTKFSAAPFPRNFIPAVEKGIVEAAANGFLAGFPVVDFKCTVYDGSYHDVDSSEMAYVRTST